MNKWFIVIIAVMAILMGILFKQNKSIEDKYKTAVANIKAYDTALSNADNHNTALELTVSQLKYFNDSVLVELNNTRKELKIKDSKLKALQYVSSAFSRTDTIVLKDTIFKSPEFKLDTILQDKWYKLTLGLKYPSQISATPEFKSEKHIIVSTKRETVNPPKKFFLLRWFQKRHTVLQVDVVEKSPYVQDENSRYIQIIK